MVSLWYLLIIASVTSPLKIYLYVYQFMQSFLPNQCLDKVSKWLISNQLTLNINAAKPVLSGHPRGML